MGCPETFVLMERKESRSPTRKAHCVLFVFLCYSFFSAPIKSKQQQQHLQARDLKMQSNNNTERINKVCSGSLRCTLTMPVWFNHMGCWLSNFRAHKIKDNFQFSQINLFAQWMKNSRTTFRIYWLLIQSLLLLTLTLIIY